jgi:hypothetical protein
MARGGYELPKVSPGPAMPNPSMPCGRATPETTLQPFLEFPAHRAGGLRPSSTLLDTPRRTLVRGTNGADLQAAFDRAPARGRTQIGTDFVFQVENQIPSSRPSTPGIRNLFKTYSKQK